jgi:hypothetical protein
MVAVRQHLIHGVETQPSAVWKVHSGHVCSMCKLNATRRGGNVDMFAQCASTMS